MTAAEYIKGKVGRKCNCWLLVRDWWIECGRQDAVDCVEARAKAVGWKQTEADYLNPIWMYMKFGASPHTTSDGCLVIMRTGNGWGMGIVVGDDVAHVGLDGRVAVKPLATTPETIFYTLKPCQQ